MFSLKTVSVVSIALFVGAHAQYSIDPTTIDPSTRASWCQSQESSCPLLCLQLPGASATTSDNTCDPDTLDYSCICGNGLSPNASQYSQTIPYFECTQWGQNCVAGCNKDSACQSACIQDHPCGAQNPVRVNATTTASTASATGSGSASTTSGQVFSGFGSTTTTAASSSTNSKSSAAAIEMGRSYGLVVVLSGVFAGFALFM